MRIRSGQVASAAQGRRSGNEGRRPARPRGPRHAGDAQDLRVSDYRRWRRINEVTADAVYKAGCLGSREGVVTIDFDGHAASLGNAIGSAVNDVEQAGLAVARADVEPLVC